MKIRFAIFTIVAILVFTTPVFSSSDIKYDIKEKQKEMKDAINSKNDTNSTVVTGKLIRKHRIILSAFDMDYYMINFNNSVYQKILNYDSNLEKTYSVKCDIIEPKTEKVIIKDNSSNEPTYSYGNVIKPKTKKIIVKDSANNKNHSYVKVVTVEKPTIKQIKIYEIYDANNREAFSIKF